MYAVAILSLINLFEDKNFTQKWQADYVTVACIPEKLRIELDKFKENGVAFS